MNQGCIRPALPAMRPSLSCRDATPVQRRGVSGWRTSRGARFASFPGVDFYWAGDQDELLVEIERFVAEVGDEETDLDRVLATVMFTDIVDSTAQGAALGDRAWAEVRTQHDQIVRSNIVRFRGREIKTMGDGFLATFDGPARGVRCAEEIAARSSRCRDPGRPAHRRSDVRRR
jgi:class 3 adenylate cyclase